MDDDDDGNGSQGIPATDSASRAVEGACDLHQKRTVKKVVRGRPTYLLLGLPITYFGRPT